MQVVTNPYDRTKIKLLFVNKTEDDITMKEELDRLAFEYPDTLEVRFDAGDCKVIPTMGFFLLGKRGCVRFFFAATTVSMNVLIFCDTPNTSPPWGPQFGP